MKWITATELQRLAERHDFRDILPALVSDLIRASVKQIDHFRFPSGDKGQVRGFDGFLLSKERYTYIPEGLSYWEFGVSANDARKLKTDFAKRVEEVPEKERKNISFVFVSPRTWDNPQLKLPDFIKEMMVDAPWQEFLYIDGSQLESWLDLCPAVAARFARYELKLTKQTGLRSTDEFWAEYSTRFKLNLTEEVLLCARQEQATQAIEHLQNGEGTKVFVADSADEVTAFSVAAIRNSEPQVRLYLEARTLIVDTVEATHFIHGQENYSYLPCGEASQNHGILNGPVLLGRGRNNPRNDYPVLTRPSFSDFGRALKSMGYPEDKGYEISKKCGRSITILQRVISSGYDTPPQWVQDVEHLIPALLVCSWDNSCDLDKQAISHFLGDIDYEDFEAQIIRLIRLEDPPIDKEGNIWCVRAPIDAWNYVGYSFPAKTFKLFAEVFTQVFSFTPEAHTDEGFSFSSPVQYSSWLRKGLATALLQIAQLSEQFELTLPEGKSGQEFVNRIIAELPNLKNDCRLLISLQNHLPYLMEAAPDPLLDTLEHLLEGNGEKILPIFDEKEDFFAPSSAHTGFLWGLETLAWSPIYLERVATILARMAAIDPGGRLGNRPINSLRAIFLAWYPHTNANYALRWAILKKVIEKVPTIRWELIEALLPKFHDNCSETSKPVLADFGASEKEVVTKPELSNSTCEIIRVALLYIDHDVKKWDALIQTLPLIPIEMQNEILDAYESEIQKIDEEKQLGYWRVLKDFLGKHVELADADWTLKGPSLERIGQLVEQYSPKSPATRLTWLFDGWTLSLKNGEGYNQKVVDARRIEAISEILKTEGIEGVLQLTNRVKLPEFIGPALVNSGCDIETLVQFVSNIMQSDPKFDDLICLISGAAYRKFEDEWRNVIGTLYNEQNWPDAKTALLFLNWPDQRDNWEFIQRLSEGAEKAFWSKKGFYQIDGELDLKIIAAQNFLSVNRGRAVIETMYQSFSEFSPELILEVLDSTIDEISQNPKSVNTMFTYYLEKTFEKIHERNDISVEDIAQREYVLLPLFERSKLNLKIYDFIANDAAFYVSLLENVFISEKKELNSEPTPESKNRATASYRLLNAFKEVCSSKLHVKTLEQLREWSTSVINIAEEKGRKKIAEEYIGQLLAHAPENTEQNTWPPLKICNLIEELESEYIEKGIRVERFNMRGAFSKAFFEGGKQERQLAGKYLNWAKACVQHPRTSAMLKAISESWEEDAKREDLRAEQDKMRW